MIIILLPPKARYTGTSSGVNAGPTTMIIASDKSIRGSFTITNRSSVYEATFEGVVDGNGKVQVNSFLEGALVMIFTGNIDRNGLLTGTYYEAAHQNDPTKSGQFELQGPKNGVINSSKGIGCTGSFVGSLDAPPHEERIAARNEALRRDGISVTGNDAIDNAATGGGGVDGGMYLEGSFSFETDANCNVIKGDAIIFGYPFGITGTVRQDRTFSLSYLGPIEGQVNSDNSISGKLLHGGGSEYIYGILNGVFTQNGKIQ